MTNDDGAYRQALDFLYDRINYERMTSGTSRYPFRLTRMRELLQRLDLGHWLHGDESGPHVPLVHIAGTKGKGSTASMVAASLTAAGIKTGLYTSPHLYDLEERFRVDGELCRPADLVRLVDTVRPLDEELIAEDKGAASFFELTTALALLHFHRSGCGAVVLETGLGGRLDSTNVCRPDVTAITTIGLDHQHVLGDTLAKIAAEKAGIIKPGVPVISGVVADEPADVIEQVASNQNARLLKIDRDFSIDWKLKPDWGSNVEFHGKTSPLSASLATTLAMEGQHQSRNAATAIAITQVLRDRLSLSIDDDTIAGALANLCCEGRIQRYRLNSGVTGIVDAAHNEDSIGALCDSVRNRATGPVAIVFGTSHDKSADRMLELIAQLAMQVDLRTIQLTRFQGNPRWRPPAELMAMVPDSIVAKAAVNENAIAACEAALRTVSPDGTLVVCGSFFLAAEAAPWMRSNES
ncbi:Folylpolyglutamate synthase [Rubripirellula tenax]|uniref:Dihydrofolate synthase/folylpolyglutamate synthase n=1 Tax=Rubripirellula tenax TaxID=2528015 RepID=A0A5C6FGL2_9BACT|nr:Mur ligase family protein [Rubripirellula tenax]TWU58809.1 Folylpolyglutamate synthase [Rubripirellula tenax]